MNANTDIYAIIIIMKAKHINMNFKEKVNSPSHNTTFGNNFIADACCFSSEDEILQWLYLNTPFAIKATNKHSKTLLVNTFTSKHAFEEVCKCLANKLYNAR